MKLSLFSTAVRYFLEVAQTGSVSQAALQLHVAGSAVSRQISKLEEAFACPLFERRARGMALTEAGERLLAYVRTGSEDAERVVEQVRGMAGQKAQAVRLACTEGFATGFIPQVIETFRQQWPLARIELTVDAPDDVSRRLLQGEVELALKYSVAPEPGMLVQHAAPAPVYALMRPTHPLARQRAVTVADVVAYPLGMSQRGMTGRQLFDLVCSQQGRQYHAAVVSNFSSALLPGVGSSDVVLSGYLTAAHLVREGRLVAVPFAEINLQQRVLQVLSLQGHTLSDTAQAFLQHLVASIRASGNGTAPMRQRRTSRQEDRRDNAPAKKSKKHAP